MDLKKRVILYETGMAILALVVVILTFISMSDVVSPSTQKIIAKVDNVIWLIFVIDYFTRLFLSQNKWHFIRSHKLDLLIIIPFDELFLGLRIARLTKVLVLFKAFFFLRTFNHRARLFLRTNHFNYVLIATIFILLIGAISISIVEDLPFDDALWWSFVTATTVGYGDISPATNLGRIIAVILMLVGIGFIGTLTGTIATFFMKRKDEPISYKDKVLHEIKGELDRFDELSEEDINDLCEVLKTLKKDRGYKRI